MNWTLLQNSLLTGIGTAVVASAIGFFAALVAISVPRGWRRCLDLLAVFSLVLPPFLVTNSWLDLASEKGALRPWLPFNFFSTVGVIWILSGVLWPVTFFFVRGAWAELHRGYLEFDPMLAGWPLLRWLLLPLATGALLQAGCVVFALSVTNFAVPSLLQVKVLPAEMWLNFNTTFDYVAALKLAWPIIILPLLVLMVVRRPNSQWKWRSQEIDPTALRRQFGRGVFVTALIVTALGIFAATAVPLLELVLARRTWSDLLAAIQAGKHALLNSIFLAAAAATVASIGAILTARWKALQCTWVFFALPGVLVAIALIWIFNRPVTAAFYHGIGIAITGLALRYFAVGWGMAAHAQSKVERVLVDAVKLEGGNTWDVLRLVYLPRLLPAMAAGWYVVYLLCLWDVETLVLIIPPGWETVSVRIFNLLHYGHNSQVNALCLALLGTALLPLVIGWGVVVLRRLSLRSTSALATVVAIAGVLVMASGCSDSQSPPTWLSHLT